ncbi:MAG TPA: hypothetical protein VG294_11750 [Solirubrobacteraceae bacterium]|jgi:hypothetical protein|nr:hypothetical protein [Solirubrobacteraceae bacterium]
MPSVGKLTFALILAGAAILVLVVSASGGTPSRGGHASCLPQGAHTLAADDVAVVFSWHGSIYGCPAATGTRENLGGAGVCNVPGGRVGPVKLARATVAYGLETCGVDTGSSQVVVRNLTSAKRLADLIAGTLPRLPESFVSVAALVLRRGGALAWIARDASIVGQHPPTYEVHRYTAGKSSLLDSGPAIDPASLRLAGRRMTWRHGSATRSSTLP